MIEKYLSVTGEYTSEKVIEKSRFITVSRRVESEEQAKNFIAEIAAKNAGATHNCYAYIADRTGNFLRFSDDGEPQGTAGMPMLEVLKNNSLCEIAVVVTRYFGGIKLGAGGLVRAYSGCVSENLAGAQKAEYVNCHIYVYEVDYTCLDALLRYVRERGAIVGGIEYGNSVTVTATVKQGEVKAFNAGLVNALNGRVNLKFKGEKFQPFVIK